jgi:hypothetical protein
MTLFQNLILFTNRYGNLQEMLEMASFLKYVDLYLTSECGRFYVGHPVELNDFQFSNPLLNMIPTSTDADCITFLSDYFKVPCDRHVFTFSTFVGNW